MHRKRTQRVGQALAGAAAVALLVAGCGLHPEHGQAGGAGRGGPGRAAPSRELVTGFFVREGGPLGPGGKQPPNRPLRGTVEFRSASGRVVTVRVGRSGHFHVYLRPGTYAVNGRSPQIVQVSDTASTGVQTRCSLPLRVRVSARHAATIRVTCIVP